MWHHADLDAMLIPTWEDEKPIPEPTLIREPARLEHADPFAPFIPDNAARFAIQVLDQHHGQRLGFAMRPCELLTFKELARRNQLDTSSTLLISTDCLSASPESERHLRAEDKDDPQNLTHEALQFASEGGFLASPFRRSCQFCDLLMAEDVDLHIGVLGLETGRHVLLMIKDPELDQNLCSDLSLVRKIPSNVDQHRQRILSNLSAWRRRTWNQALSNLDRKHSTLEALIAHLEHCDSCRDRLAMHCPLFHSSWRSPQSSIHKEDAVDWLAACTGCGTCEHQCPDGYPLVMTILSLRQRNAPLST
jgi:formate dehydrogenase subunit beta